MQIFNFFIMSTKKPGEKNDVTTSPDEAIAESAQTNIIQEIRVKIRQSGQFDPSEAQVTQILRGEALTSQEITPELVNEVSDFYLWLFRNTMHFTACPPCEMKGLKARLTAKEIFGTTDSFVPSEQMDSIEEMPACPCCQNGMQLIYHPDTLKENFRQKMLKSDESFLSLLRKEDGSIAGLGFAYITNLNREMSLEWPSRYPYMRPDQQKPEYQRSKGRFLTAVGGNF